MRRCVLLLASLAVALAVLPTRAPALVYDPAYVKGSHTYDWYFNPAEHDRFYEGPDRDFIGEAFDWSGVGHANVSSPGIYDWRWAVAISPSWFLTANHYRPADGATVTFYGPDYLDNPEDVYERTVKADSYHVLFWEGVQTDLCLGRFTEALDPNDVALYPIANLGDDSQYIDEQIYLYGTYGWPSPAYRGSVAQNNIYGIVNDPYGIIGRAMKYDYDTGGNDGNEAIVSSGDSGGPSFIVVNGDLSLVGIHWLSDDVTKKPSPWYSWDSFVPAYLDQIQSLVSESDLNGDGFVGGADLDIIRAHWGASVVPWDLLRGDASGDGYVGGADLDILRAHWGEGTRPPGLLEMGTVPEPATVASLLGGLVTLGGLALLRRRR